MLICEHCRRPVPPTSRGKRFCGKACAASGPQPHRTANPVDRFAAFVNKTDDCWLWTGARTNAGYGVFQLRLRVQVRAHRYSYETSVGPIPNGMLVCHRCDNRLCVRPEHLFLGTHDDNMADMVGKGRQARGLRQWKAARAARRAQ